MALEQVNRYKYLASWITEDARCEEELKARIGMAKAAFWQNKEARGEMSDLVQKRR